MAADDTPKTLGEVIDDVERIREELLSLQRSLEKMELDTPTESDAGAKPSSGSTRNFK